MTVFEDFCKNALSANDRTSKNIIFAVDLNNNILDYESKIKVQCFLSNMFQFNMIPTINKLTRVTRNTSKYIDRIIRNIVGSGIQHRSVILKSDISHHFPIVSALNTRKNNKPEDKTLFIFKCIYEEDQTELFMHELGQIEWSSIIKTLDNQNTA